MSLTARPFHSSPTGAVVCDAAPTSVATHADDANAGRDGGIDLLLRLKHAGTRIVHVRYSCVGPSDAPLVFVAGGISADRHVTAWWGSQVGPGCAIDTRHVQVLAIDWLGSDGALDVPLDPADQADAIAALLDALGIDTLEAFVGCSYGAQVGLQFAARHGSRLRQLVAISGVHRAHPYASAWRALQRRAVALGALQCDDAHGLALARQLAVLSYRTPEEFDGRFGEAVVTDGRVRVDAEDYLDLCADRYVARTPVTAFLRLSESIDLQAVDPERITVPTTVVAVAEDRLVPVVQAYELVERLRGETRLHVLRSRYGHDAFLKEHAAIAALLDDVLQGIGAHGACREVAA